MNQQKQYLSYLLRLWQESGGSLPLGNLPHGEPPLWRASLQSPQGEERQGFASLEDLFAFLQNETGSSSPGVERSDEKGRQPPAPPE